MAARINLSIILIASGLLLALLPLRNTRSMSGNPEEVLSSSLAAGSTLSPDQVAYALVKEDSAFQLIDLRSPEEFRSFSIPGAINIPYGELAGKNPETYLGKGSFRNVFYSNSDLYSSYAVVLSRGYGFNNSFFMNGGLSSWFDEIMESSFSGEKISARENALFEIRYRARRLFNEFNSMPDSVKLKFLSSKKFDPKKLDGGCE